MLHVFFVADKYRNLYCVVLCTVHTLYLHCLLLIVRRAPTSYFIYCIIYCTALYECTYDYSGPPYMYIHIVKYEHNLYRDLFYFICIIRGSPYISYWYIWVYYVLIYGRVPCIYVVLLKGREQSIERTMFLAHCCQLADFTAVCFSKQLRKDEGLWKFISITKNLF